MPLVVARRLIVPQGALERADGEPLLLDVGALQTAIFAQNNVATI